MQYVLVADLAYHEALLTPHFPVNLLLRTYALYGRDRRIMYLIISVGVTLAALSCVRPHALFLLAVVTALLFSGQ